MCTRVCSRAVQATFAEDEEDDEDEEKEKKDEPKCTLRFMHLCRSRACRRDTGQGHSPLLAHRPAALRHCQQRTSRAIRVRIPTRRQRIEEHDIPLLEHLTDIKVVPNAEAGTGFALQFFFSQNEWFSDAVGCVISI